MKKKDLVWVPLFGLLIGVNEVITESNADYAPEAINTWATYQTICLILLSIAFILA